MPIEVPVRTRFRLAYALLALCVVGGAAATWSQTSRPASLSPQAEALVERFLGALQAGDLQTACALFSELPACKTPALAVPLVHYHVFPAEPAVDGVDVPATLDGQYALFAIAEHLGRYRIDDVITDPASFAGGPAIPAPSYAA